MENNKAKTMKRRLMALLLCVAMMLNGSVSALASEVITENEVEPLMKVAEEAHVHTKECYLFTKVSEDTICGKEVVEGHTHGNSCYEITNTQECICGVNETEGHSHVDTCFETIENLVCDKEHSHDDSCYTISSELNCGQEESEEHAHVDECYEESKEITCGKEHSHDGGCYETETKNVCGLEEVEAHTHGEECFKTVEVKKVICGLEEVESHAHSEECYEWNKELVCTIEASEPEMAAEVLVCEVCGKEACECEVMVCEACGKETCECEVLVCEVCEKETCECETIESIKLVTEVDGTTITLIGPVSAFEEGKTYEITAAKVESEEELEVIEEALEGAAEAQKKVVESYQAFDITIIEKDETGAVTNENFQPLNETPVQVVFTGEKVAESVINEETEVTVYWIDEENSVTDMDAVSDGTGVVMETEHFSVYVVTEVSDQTEAYVNFLAELEALENIDELDETEFEKVVALNVKTKEAYKSGELNEEEYTVLAKGIVHLIKSYAEINPIAESGDSRGLLEKLLNKGWFCSPEQYSEEALEEAEAADDVIENPERNESNSNAVEAPMMFKLRKANLSSAAQIVNVGGAQSNNDVNVSKTIAGTNQENVFDISLKVETPQKISAVFKDPDLALVVVMDISQTMSYEYSNDSTTSRYESAMAATEVLFQKFADATYGDGTSRIGFVTFNTSAKKVFDLRKCAGDSTVETLTKLVETETGKILDQSGYATSSERFTNVEAGLKMAKDMLDKSECDNKYIIFLSDGFPTTYIQSGYTGHNPELMDGTFYDAVYDAICEGTSYSDKASIRAREMATQIKNSGVKIFSVGVDIGGQTIQQYVDISAPGWSIVDRTSESYEIGSATSSQAYKDWLRDKIGSGSGHYEDSTNAAGVTKAFENIFKAMSKEIQEKATSNWVVTDPMGTMVEFIGFYNKSGALTSGNLKGSFGSGKEDTATYDSSTSKFAWDLKNSGYSSTTSGDVTTYTFEIKYRVRLKNEKDSFLEKENDKFIEYKTNKTTTLKYNVIEKINGQVVKSEPRDINFKIPKIEGYLSELEFKKVDPDGNPVVGATFTLAHDTESCGYCRGDESKSVTIKDFTVTSNTQGNVVFNNIPSGHIYKLKETGVPSGYFSLGEEYQVTVAYDNLTVELIGAPDEWVWNSKIVNGRMYELPSTGGIGTEMYKISGLALMGVATLFLHKKKKDEEVQG